MRARERGREFTITRENWRDWCVFHSFITGANRRHKDGMTVDRINVTQGYHIWNIRPLPLGVNSRIARAPWEIAQRYLQHAG
jgi:hypothetical protein